MEPTQKLLETNPDGTTVAEQDVEDLRGRKLTRRLLKLQRIVKKIRKQLRLVKRWCFYNKPIRTPDKHKLSNLRFLKSQLSARKIKKRWSFEEKVMLLSVYKKSKKRFNLLREIFYIPTIRMLKRQLSTIKLKPGLNNFIVNTLNSFSGEMVGRERYCLLSFDEMRIDPDLELITGSVEGFVSYRKRDVANRVVVFMLRGIYSSWKQPISFYFTKNRRYLKRWIVENIRAVHSKTNFSILASVSNHSKSNVRTIKLLSRNDDFVYNIDGSEIFHIFDTSKLIIGLRDIFIKNNVVFDGSVGTIDDIRKMYGYDSEGTDHGRCCGLTDIHFNPTGCNKTSVKYARELFGHKVFCVLVFLQTATGWDLNGTVRFMEFMDKLTSSLNTDVISRKSYHMDRKRFIRDKFWHVQFWTEAVPKLKELKFVKNDEIIPPPRSIKYLIPTLNNLGKLWDVLKNVGFRYFFTSKINQEPLQNFFHTIKCVQNSRPTTTQFISAFKTAINSSSKIYKIKNDKTNFLFTFKTISKPLTTPTPTPTPPYIQLPKISSKHRNHHYSSRFIIKKILFKIKCESCQKFLLTNESHSLFSININDKKYFPSEEFIKIVNSIKKQVCRLFIHNYKQSNIIKFITKKINVDVPKFCDLHRLSRFIKEIVTHIMVQYIIMIINQKLRKKNYIYTKQLDSVLKYFVPNSTTK